MSSKFQTTFPNSEALFHAYKDPNNQRYIQSLAESESPRDAKSQGRKCLLRSDWEHVKYTVMIEVLTDKATSNPHVRTALVTTGIQPMYEHTDRDNVWGDGGANRTGLNLLGKAWSTVRLNL
jgi:ribA/ribD-fused uncharacterized protein